MSIRDVSLQKAAAEKEFLTNLRSWQKWSEEFEYADFEKVWSAKEILLQDELRTSSRKRLADASKPAFLGQLFTITQVSFPTHTFMLNSTAFEVL
jgi:hypothetical protein